MQYKLDESVQKNGAIPIPSSFDRVQFQKSLNSSANMIFHAATGLPLQSSPVSRSNNLIAKDRLE